MFKYVEVVNDSGHVEVAVLVGELDSGVSNVSTLGVVVVAPTGQHARCTVD